MIDRFKRYANEFKTFAIKGNVIDMAVGIIIGGAFSPIVSSLVNDIIMPPIGFIMGNVDFSNLYIPVNPSGQSYPTLAEAQNAWYDYTGVISIPPFCFGSEGEPEQEEDHSSIAGS